MTDWGATLDVEGPTLKDGGDIEMGSSRYHTADGTSSGGTQFPGLRQLIDNGELTWEDVDEGVRHVLTAYGRIGYLGLVEVLPDGTAAAAANPPD